MRPFDRPLPVIPVPDDPPCPGPCAEACGPLLGASAVMRAVYAKIERFARKDVNVVITGESGTGKDLVARNLHACSARAGKPFVAINCAALPDTLLESELFGYERGAFTGAVRSAPGKLAQAHGGTLFLDEIGSMSLASQAKLLRVVETRRVEPLGGGRPVAADFRLVAATNEDLAAKAAQGTFRHDLFHRLWVVNVHLPPLRERREDIPVLVHAFLERRPGPHGLRWTVPDDLMAALTAHAWPGNVRELANVVEHLVAMSDDGTLRASDLPDSVHIAADGRVAAPSPSLSARVLRYERDLIEAALREADGNRTRAAHALGISRENLVKKVRKHGLGGA